MTHYMNTRELAERFLAAFDELEAVASDSCRISPREFDAFVDAAAKMPEADAEAGADLAEALYWLSDYTGMSRVRGCVERLRAWAAKDGRDAVA